VPPAYTHAAHTLSNREGGVRRAKRERETERERGRACAWACVCMCVCLCLYMPVSMSVSVSMSLCAWPSGLICPPAWAAAVRALTWRPSVFEPRALLSSPCTRAPTWRSWRTRCPARTLTPAARTRPCIHTSHGPCGNTPASVPSRRATPSIARISRPGSRGCLSHSTWPPTEGTPASDRER
jgi:hypothetical protein